MKIRPVTVGIVAAVLMTGAAFALAEARIPRKPLRAMTCHDFLLVEDAAKPEIVYWAATYRKDGKPDRTVIDVSDRTNTSRNYASAVQHTLELPSVAPSSKWLLGKAPNQSPMLGSAS